MQPGHNVRNSLIDNPANTMLPWEAKAAPTRKALCRSFARPLQDLGETSAGPLNGLSDLSNCYPCLEIHLQSLASLAALIQEHATSQYIEFLNICVVSPFDHLPDLVREDR